MLPHGALSPGVDRSTTRSQTPPKAGQMEHTRVELAHEHRMAGARLAIEVELIA